MLVLLSIVDFKIFLGEDPFPITFSWGVISVQPHKMLKDARMLFASTRKVVKTDPANRRADVSQSFDTLVIARISSYK